MKKPSLNSLLRLNFSLLLLLFPAGQLTRIQLTPTVALNLIDLAAFTLVLYWSLLIWRKSIRLSFPPFFHFISSFMLLGILSLLINYPQFQTKSIISGLYLTRWFLYALLFPITYHLKQQKIINFNSHHLFSLLLAISLLGIAQYLLIPDTRFLFRYGWDDHLNRLISTIFDPGFTGLLLVFGLHHWLVRKKSLPTIYPAILLVSLALTYARSAYFVFFISLIFSLLLFRQRRRALAAGASFLFLLTLLPQNSGGEGVNLSRTYSIHSRVETSLTAWDLFLQKPLLGFGFNSYSLALSKPFSANSNHANSPDNSYLLLLTTTGILGTAVYLFWQGKILSWSSRHSPLLFLTTIALIAHSFTNNSLFHPHISIYYWLLLAEQTAKPHS